MSRSAPAVVDATGVDPETSPSIPAVAEERQGLDPWLLLAAFLLAGLGLVMIVSASAPYAERIGQGAWSFGLRQAIGLGLGAGVGLVTLAVPWARIRDASPWILGATAVAMFLVHSPIGVEVNGAPRWIDLGPINLQPSEFAKLALALVLADHFARNASHLRDVVGTVPLPLALYLGPLALGAVGQSDLGALVLLVAVAGVALFVAGLEWRWLLLAILLAVGLVALLVIVEPYRMYRLTSFVDPHHDAEGAGYQVVQGWVAMATGGALGQGLGEGVAQRGFLPEAHTDMISAVVVEELGVPGWLTVLALQIVVVLRGSRIAVNARSLYGTLLASCLVAVLGAQALINTAVVVGWSPPKGLVLPLMSYGPSAAIVHVAMIALLLKIGLETSAAPPRADAAAA